MVGVKPEGDPRGVGAADCDPRTVEAADCERRAGVCGVDGLLTAGATDPSRCSDLPRRAFVSLLLVVLRERALCIGVSSSLADLHDD